MNVHKSQSIVNFNFHKGYIQIYQELGEGVCEKDVNLMDLGFFVFFLELWSK